MNRIQKIIGREIIDSRGNPTVEADVLLTNGALGRAAVPSGASTGSHEAVELRDGLSRFSGKGVLKAINNINTEIQNTLADKDPFDQRAIDDLLISIDATPNKSNLGGNAILGVSLAVARAAANARKEDLYHYLGEAKEFQLPVPLMNVINGGEHADNSIDFQEFMIIPHGANTFLEAVQMSCEVFQTLKNNLRTSGFSTNIGDEGGFAPSFNNSETAIEAIIKAVKDSGYSMEKQFLLGLDCASTEFFLKNQYALKGENKVLSSEQMVEELKKIRKKYPIFSIEDGMAEDDWGGWKQLTESIGNDTQLVGDDLFVTNKFRLRDGIRQKVGNAILIKPNQIGTLSETRDTIRMAKNNKYQCIMSHRSGETEDTFIADLAVASGCSQIKSGSLSRSDRLAKYNQLIRIEEKLGAKSNYIGRDILANFQ